MPSISSGKFVSLFYAELVSTKPRLPPTWIAICRQVWGSRKLQKVDDMNIVTEANIAGQPIVEKPRARPVRMVRWFIIIGLLLALLVGALVGFNAFRSHMIAQFFANNKPPPTPVAVAVAKSEVVPNLLTAVGDLAAVHQVNVTSDVSGRITDIMFTAGSSVKAG